MQLASGLPFYAPPPTDIPWETYGAGASTAPITATMSPEDARTFDDAASILRHSPTGAAILDGLIARNAKVVVESPEVWRTHGYAPSVVAVTTLDDDTIHLQRDVLADPAQRTHNAVVVAHEGQHLLDDLSGVDAKWRADVNHDYNIYLRRGDAASAAELVRQARLTHTVVAETRAYIAGGKIARELGEPESVANEYGRIAARADDPDSPDTWARTEDAVLHDEVYNPEQLALYPPDWPDYA
jgi:hypothetical protein